jgi:hypothetical protein
MKQLGVTLFESEELANLKDPHEVAVGYGMMACNTTTLPGSVQLPLPALKVLEKCCEIGNRSDIP